jgi:NTP pyrophosphatase (non-canonical NTP hydrolase)
MHERDTPKNLATALVVESSELLEPFLWLQTGEKLELTEIQFQHVKEEIGDVMIYLLALADRLEIDPIKCAIEKMRLNEEKYPAKSD